MIDQLEIIRLLDDNSFEFVEYLVARIEIESHLGAPYKSCIREGLILVGLDRSMTSEVTQVKKPSATLKTLKPFSAGSHHKGPTFF